MSADQAAEPDWVRCDHHWVHIHQGDTLIWIPKCSQCGHFNAADINEQITTLVAAGRSRALVEATEAVKAMHFSSWDARWARDEVVKRLAALAAVTGEPTP